MENYLEMKFLSIPENVSFSRSTVSAFCLALDPSVEELNDVKTAVSEAVTNSIVHGYKDKFGKIYINGSINENTVKIIIRDKGCGIENIEEAMTPLFTTGGGDRAGLGFTVMESFCDKLKVRSKIGYGTSVTLIKKIEGKSKW